MATNNFIKFSLLIGAVLLSSYVCYTEATERCPLAPTATPQEMESCYNCTKQNCETSYGSCTGSKCSTLDPIRALINVDISIKVKALLDTCNTTCSLQIYAAIDAIVTLLALVATLLLNLIVSAGAVLGASYINIINVHVQLCASILADIGIAAALDLRLSILQLGVLVTAAINALIAL